MKKKSAISLGVAIAISALGLGLLLAQEETPMPQAVVDRLMGSQASPAPQQGLPVEPPAANPAIDYQAFAHLVTELAPLRESRRVSVERFMEMAAEPNTIVLDARSVYAYNAVHMKGAVNLPFSDFNQGKLAEVIPSKDTKILIYCNNNFKWTGPHPPDDADNQAKWDQIEAFQIAERLPSKSIALALNIPTFINLVGYGYENVWELGPQIDLAQGIPLPMEGTAVAEEH